MRVERTDDARIVYVHDVLTPEECRALIELAEATGFDQPGLVVGPDGGNVVNEAARKCREIWFDRHPELAAVEARMAQLVTELGRLYQQQVARVAGPLKPERPRFVRYAPDSYFRLHFDKRDCYPNEWRQLGVVLHLSSCRGGHTVFPHQAVACHTSPGSALLFPVAPDYVHEAQPPREGETKYILLTWLACPADVMPDAAELIDTEAPHHAAP